MKTKIPLTPEQQSHSDRIKRGRLRSQQRAARLIAEVKAATRGRCQGVAELRLESMPRSPFDLGWIEEGLLVEIDGGCFMPGGGAHSRGKGVERQNNKRNKALLGEWRVLVFTTQQVDRGEALPVILAALDIGTLDIGTEATR